MVLVVAGVAYTAAPAAHALLTACASAGTSTTCSTSILNLWSMVTSNASAAAGADVVAAAAALGKVAAIATGSGFVNIGLGAAKVEDGAMNKDWKKALKGKS